VVNDVTARPADVDRVRAFNRFYTRVIGVLDAGLVGTAYSLVEARLLYELAHAPGPTPVTELRRRLDLDPGYLSRLLGRLEGAGLVHRTGDPGDGRRQLAGLTDAGRATFADLDRRQVDSVAALLEPLPPERRAELTRAMAAIERALGGPDARTVVLRPPGPGDLGWVVSRHGAVYAREYGWDATFEAMVARIVANHAAGHDPAREAGWIAEVDGEPVGSVFCMADDERTARLRLLLVEPSARGLGVGSRLVEECLRFARRAGYRRITLWTNGALLAARRVYQAAGFTLDREVSRAAFGGVQVEQDWSRDL
jgi:DNA-binding MarR family transcriptional regulator/predicted N-acetyltransferase YhbS